jgi:hypothetical protein
MKSTCSVTKCAEKHAKWLHELMTKGSAMEEVDGGHQIRPGWALKVLKRRR